MANKLAKDVAAPSFAVFSQVGVVWWLDITGGPFTVALTESRKVREVVESDVSNRIEYSGPGPFSEPIFRKRFAEAEDWGREYEENRYLRFETRQELNQRFQDLVTNMTILSGSGEVVVTEEKVWHRLFRHVLAEMWMRDQPPVARNLDPTVEKAILYPDPELCSRAAQAVSRRPGRPDVLVKYGKAFHMRRLFVRGQVYMNSASYFDRPELHNQAVYDKERTAVYKGVFEWRATRERIKREECGPAPHLDPAKGHMPMCNAPEASEDEYYPMQTGVYSDYWMYCMSGSLVPRLFSDFDADSCVVVDGQRFASRLAEAWARSAWSKTSVMEVGWVEYDDPLGAYTALRSGTFKPDLYFTKTFRYAYQNELRFVAKPEVGYDNLDPIELELGSLHDIGELIVL
ncbi:MAG: hypothetical protein OXH15_03130 [Gammaproteobacteria bacterium]|nr:hypothetical protein [Gammaproteobacteria bacterium]